MVDRPQTRVSGPTALSRVVSLTRIEHGTSGLRDLAPMIFRQRLVIEGTCLAPIREDHIRAYLSRLSDICGMRRLMEPVLHQSERYGWAGWIHWEDSGAHFYAWDLPKLFFSVDIYTCKGFDAERACEFTRAFFNATEVVALTF